MSKVLSKIPKPGDGMNGEGREEVKLWQTALKNAGFGPGAIDGIWGRKTTAATSRFQVFHNLKGTGTPGPETVRLLGFTIGAPQKSGTISTGTEPDEATLPWYRRMFKAMEIDPGFDDKVLDASKLVLRGMKRYEKVSQAIWGKIDYWWIIGALHYKEASCNFEGCLANGEKIIGKGKKTTLVPKGLGPWETWEDSAIDILKIKKWDQWKSFEIGDILFHVERYNGLGYVTGAGKEDTSPYLWDMTNVNDGRGRYTHDGKYDPNAEGNKSAGFCAIAWTLAKNDIIVIEQAKVEAPKLTRQVIADKIIGYAQKDVDAKLRETHGKNRSPRIDELNKRAKSYLGAPYCASGLWVAMDDTCKELGLVNPAAPTASSQAFRRDNYVPKKYMSKAGALGKKGEFGVFQQTSNAAHGHLTAVSEDQAKKPSFNTVEYNTNGEGSRDGDGAYNRTRSTAAKSPLKFICFTDVAQWILDANS